MAVQKSKVTRSRRGQRRSHDALSQNELMTCSVTGEVHRRHHVTKSKFYRGKPIMNEKTANTDSE
jgi:large subunit ribosomal protein L32|tara:strand:+ start:3476 stop:3670 length:195 start_codon:yes stop_codon:yes gene_type:complete